MAKTKNKSSEETIIEEFELAKDNSTPKAVPKAEPTLPDILAQHIINNNTTQKYITNRYGEEVLLETMLALQKIKESE